MPYTRSTPSIAPAAIMGSAPPTVSSAGWNSRRTVPDRLSRISQSSRAAPSSMAACASCPQACIMPGCSEAKGRPVSSWMGSASISARRAMVSRDARPRMTPMVQVRSPEKGMPMSVSVRRIISRVLNSSKPRSGTRCRAWRISARPVGERPGGLANFLFVHSKYPTIFTGSPPLRYTRGTRRLIMAVYSLA